MTTPSRSAWAAAAAILVALGLLLAESGAAPVERYGLVDFYDYYFAADAVARHEDPYDPALADARAVTAGVPVLAGSNYVYPPWFAGALVPLTWLRPHAAGLVWFGISALALALAIRELARWCGSQWAPLVAVLFPGTMVALFVGQVNPGLLALLVGAWRWRETRPLRAGGLLGIAIAIKLTPLLLLLPCLRWRRWRTIGAALAVAAVCALVGELVVPGGGWHFLTRVAPHASELRPELAHPSNQGIGGAVLRMLSPNPWTTPWIAAPGAVDKVASALVAVVLVVLVWRAIHGNDERNVWALAITALVIVSPLAWEALFILLLFPLAALASTRPRTALACILLTVLQRALDDFAHAPEHYPWLRAAPPLTSLGLAAGVILYIALVWDHGR